MNQNEAPTENLFSYGTLRNHDVQLDIFGRTLDGKPDALPGYRLRMIEIQDQDFVIKSGTAHHRNIQFTGNAADAVEGIAFSVTMQELQHSDEYEPDGYQRVQIQLRSGLNAWVYLNINP